MNTAPAHRAAVDLDEFVEVAKALANPGRLRVLAMLRDGSLCVCQIASVLGFTSSTVSSHLTELRRAHLVSEQKRGKWVHYRLNEDESLRRLLDDILRLLADDPQMIDDARVVRALRKVPVDDLCRAGLDLTAVGVKPRLAAISARGRNQRNVD